jgi:hypothetical protein
MPNFYVIDQNNEVSEDTTCREVTLSFLRELGTLDGARIGMDFGDWGVPKDFRDRISKANQLIAKYGLPPITLDADAYHYHTIIEVYNPDTDWYDDEDYDLDMPVLCLHEPVYLPVVHAFLGCVRDNEDEDWFMLELISRVVKKVADYDDGASSYRRSYNGAMTFLNVTDPKVWVPDFIELRKPDMGLGEFSPMLLAILIEGGLYDYGLAKRLLFRGTEPSSIKHSYTANGESIAPLGYVACYAKTFVGSHVALQGFRNQVNYPTPWGTYNIWFVDSHIVEYTSYHYHGEVK